MTARYKIYRIGKPLIGYSYYIEDTCTGSLIEPDTQNPKQIEQQIKKLNEKHRKIITLPVRP